MKDQLEILKNVQKAEVSPFLITRIKQKIESLEQSIASPKVVWSLVSVLIIVLLLDIFVLKNYTKTEKTDITQTLSLTPNNQLY